ncbi:hypothetical protein [Halorarius litoreus]|uniref:hypothetical protein n=1 Tax=Halorarius litoreus TaxID=2962676 RepID=UPI0020CFC8B2|nr:hypothetical protein [Halorarius litoreus]
MSSKTDELRELFARLTTETTFTEHQQHDSHTLPSERQLDTALRRLVTEMRDEYGFRTSLDDDALVTVVRAFYADTDDAAIADELGVGTGVVRRARLHLHLFRETDRKGAVDLRALATALDAGHTVEECAVELDASETAVERARQVLEARRQAQRSGYHYPLAFESLLDEAGLPREVSAARRRDRDALVDVFD